MGHCTLFLTPLDNGIRLRALNVCQGPVCVSRIISFMVVKLKDLSVELKLEPERQCWI